MSIPLTVIVAAFASYKIMSKTHRYVTVEEILKANGFIVVQGAIMGDFWGWDKRIKLSTLEDFISIAKELNVTKIYYYHGISSSTLYFLHSAEDFVYSCSDTSGRWIPKLIQMKG